MCKYLSVSVWDTSPQLLNWFGWNFALGQWSVWDTATHISVGSRKMWLSFLFGSHYLENGSLESFFEIDNHRSVLNGLFENGTTLMVICPTGPENMIFLGWQPLLFIHFRVSIHLSDGTSCWCKTHVFRIGSLGGSTIVLIPWEYCVSLAVCYCTKSRVMWSVGTVCLSVCLSLREHDNSQKHLWMSTKHGRHGQAVTL